MARTMISSAGSRSLVVGSLVLAIALPLLAVDAYVNNNSPVRYLLARNPVLVWITCAVCLLLDILMHEWLLRSDWVRVPTAASLTIFVLLLDLAAVGAIAAVYVK